MIGFSIVLQIFLLLRVGILQLLKKKRFIIIGSFRGLPTKHTLHCVPLEYNGRNYDNQDLTITFCMVYYGKNIHTHVFKYFFLLIIVGAKGKKTAIFIFFI